MDTENRHIICINYMYLTFSCYVNLLERFNNSWSTQYKWVHVTHMLKRWRATPCSAKISEKLSNNAGSKDIATVTSHYITPIKRNYRHLLLLRCSHSVCLWLNERMLVQLTPINSRSFILTNTRLMNTTIQARIQAIWSEHRQTSIRSFGVKPRKLHLLKSLLKAFA